MSAWKRALVLAACLPVTEAAAADWEWTIAPYLFAAGVNVDLVVHDEPVIGNDISFPDLLQELDLAGMVRFEGRRGKVGFSVDALYLSLGGGHITPPRPPLPGGTRIDSDLDAGLYDIGGFYRFIEEGSTLDLLFGARVIDVGLRNDVALPSPSTVTTTVEISETLLDGFVGLRYGQPLGGRWSLLFRGDVGTGDTEFTWNVLGAANLRLGQTERHHLIFGWRHLDIDMETTSGSDSQLGIVFSGPIVAYAFTF